MAYTTALFDSIVAKAWNEVATGTLAEVPTAARPDTPAHVSELPYFRFLKWMTVRALRRIDQNIESIRPGARGCIIQTAYNVVASEIGTPEDAIRLAYGDWKFNLQQQENTGIFATPAKGADVSWLPNQFDSDDAYWSANAMMEWNDSGMYDHEKRMLLHAAVDQEFARRALTPPCGRRV